MNVPSGRSSVSLIDRLHRKNHENENENETTEDYRIRVF